MNVNAVMCLHNPKVIDFFYVFDIFELFWKRKQIFCCIFLLTYELNAFWCNNVEAIFIVNLKVIFLNRLNDLSFNFYQNLSEELLFWNQQIYIVD